MVTMFVKEQTHSLQLCVLIENLRSYVTAVSGYYTLRLPVFCPYVPIKTPQNMRYLTTLFGGPTLFWYFRRKICDV